MGILHTALKTLLICATTFAVAQADENPLSESDPVLKPVTQSTESSQKSALRKSNHRWSGRSASRRQRPQPAPSMFFSPSSSSSATSQEGLKSNQKQETLQKPEAAPANDPARATDEPGPVNDKPVQFATAAPADRLPAGDSRRHRMQMSLPADSSTEASDALPQREKAEPQAQMTPVLRATFDVDAEEPGDNHPAVRQVAANNENPFSNSAPADDAEEVTFDFSEDEGDTAQESFDFTVDAADELEESFDFDDTEIGFESTSDFDDTPTEDTADLPTAVPHSSDDELPVSHTGAQTPQIEVLWVGQDTLNIGQKSTCSLVVVNSGSSLVRNVVVEAAIPEGMDVVQASPAPVDGSSRWAIGDLKVDERRVIELVVIPRERGNVAMNAFVRFTGYATSVFSIKEPLLEMTVDGPDSVTVGEQAGYVVTVHNPGSGVARNVVIEARVPEGMQHRSGSVPRIDVGTLSPGESRQARLNLAAIAGGDFRLAVRTIADGGLRDEARADIAIAEPRLQVAISGPETGSVGKPTDYEITVTNSGNVPSINVRTKYKLPAGARFIDADRGGVLQEDEQLVDWFVGTLQPGESAAYHITLSAGSPGTALHRAGVVSEHTSASMASHSVEVKGLPRLQLTVQAAERQAEVGEETVVEIVVNNAGGIAASKVGLFCELPSGLEFVAAGGPSEHLAENGVVIFRSLTGIAAGESVTYRIKARCVRAGSHRIRARAASESLTDPVHGEGSVNATSAR